MRFSTAILLGMLISLGPGVLETAAQPAPCDTCESCGPPCGCAGHDSGCCCAGICKHAPNPLAPGRPSPPPCCADGYCYPNYETWGHYKTRWRRWPIEFALPTPEGAKAPPAARPDVPPYDALPPEEEDRRAPPPTAPRGKPVEIGPRRPGTQEGPDGREGDRPSTPTTPTTPLPQDLPSTELTPESIFGEPPEDTPGAAPSGGAPTDETPTTTPLAPPAGGEPLGLPPLGEPMGDDDRPPALPFTAPKLSNQPAMRSNAPKPAIAPPRNLRTGAEDDPPPALPSVLALN